MYCRAEHEAEATINGDPILIGPDGFFTKELNLKNGLNTISITAQKKYSRTNKQIKTIMVNSNN